MIDNHVHNLFELRRPLSQEATTPWHLRRIQPELNGGKISQEELTRLADSPLATTLTISGLEQKTFEFLCKNFGTQFTAIHFWKCPRIVDLSPLEDMPQLTHVALFWNQRATRLWTLERTPLLRGLHFDDFTKLQDLTDLAAASSLEDLAFGNANWSKFVVPSLEPLSGLSHLQSLAFRVKAVIDNKIQPLANLTHLAELSFSANLFTTSQLAWLRAHLPATVSATVLAPYQQLRQPLTTRGKKLDVLISGKGKPFLSSETDSVKLSRYITEFNKMVLQFSDNAQLEP